MPNSCELSRKMELMKSAFDHLASLIKLLPTGTVFAYQFLNPLLIGDGRCNPLNKGFSALLIVVCGLLCFLDTFTDSYKTSDGIVHYGIATFKGFFPSNSSAADVDLSSYKIRFGDFVHAIFSLLVFSIVALLNDDSVDCFYPSFGTGQKVLLMVLPTIIGSISSVVFFFFPTKRHYIGYTPHTSISRCLCHCPVANSVNSVE